MNSLITTPPTLDQALCRCGHWSSVHGDAGCAAGRYRPCGCQLDAATVEAIEREGAERLRQRGRR